MEILIFLFIVLGAILYYVFLAYAYSGHPDRKIAERKQNKQVAYEELKKRSNFRQIDEVQGILNVDGKDIHTFNIGDLIIGNQIVIQFYNNFDGPTTISDICFNSNNQSIFGRPDYNMSVEKKTELALNILNQLSNEGKVRKSTVREITIIFKELQELNELIHKGRIKRENNEAETYICSY